MLSRLDAIADRDRRTPFASKYHTYA